MAKTKDFTYFDDDVLRRRGAHWLVIAANLGYSEAQEQLASSYEFGKNGVRIDKIAAAYWHKRANGELIPGKNDYEYENYYLENVGLSVKDKRDRALELERIALEGSKASPNYSTLPLKTVETPKVQPIQPIAAKNDIPLGKVVDLKPVIQPAAASPAQQAAPVLSPQPVAVAVPAPIIQPVEEEPKYDLSKPPVDLDKLEQQAKTGNPKALVAYGKELIKIPARAAEGFENINKAAGLGLSDGLYELAVCYLNGDGVAQDTVLGLEKLKESVVKQNGYAIAKMADLRVEGKLLPKDYQTAFNEYQEAAKKNIPNALYKIGSFYSANNMGVDKDINKACEFFEKAAALKDPNAERELGLIYYYGKAGKAVDKSKALELLISSAREGNSIAKSMLEKLF
jgi:TPR repeat protein